MVPAKDGACAEHTMPVEVLRQPQVCHRPLKPLKTHHMLLTIAVILLALWGLGLVTHIAGGLIHIILVIALVVFILHFVRGRA